MVAETNSPSTPSEAGSRRCLTPRAVVVSLVLTFLGVLWIRQSELLSFTCQITESIPPIPGLAVLFLFALLRPLAARMGFSRGEIAVIYVFVGVGTVMSAVGVTQAFLPYLTVPHYFSDLPDLKIGELADLLPAWIGPRDPEVIRTFYEGLDGRPMPWGEWVGPLALWLGFFLVYWWTATCVWTLFRAQWVERERLTFPVVSIPVRLTEPPGSGDEPTFFRNRLAWLGFGLVAAYHVINVLHIMNPSVTAPGAYFSLGQYFTERPLNVLGGLSIWHRPELIGLGFLVPLDILFSVWFLFVLQQVVAVLGAVAGVDSPGYPFPGDQAMGAYLAVAVALVLLARRHLRAVVRQAVRRGHMPGDRAEPLPYRVAVFGLVAGFAALVLFACKVGVALRIAMPFFAMLLSFGLVYCRIRCESGTPSIWVLQHSELKFLPTRLFGSDLFKVGGSYRCLANWTVFQFLTHGGFFNQTTVYQMESYKLADETGASRREMTVTGLAAVAVGLVLAYWMFLSTYYDYGTNVLAGGSTTGTGGVRIGYCLESWVEAAQKLDAATAPEIPRRWAFGVGFVVALALLGTRTLLLRSVISPLGYIMAFANGMQLWWSFLIAWAAKALILKLGGVGLYRRAVPFFLGIAVGHFFVGGVVWGTLAAFFRDIEYIIWFP